MSRNYKFRNPEAAYFVSFAVVEWLDVFTRNEYKDIVIESLNYCQKNKGMEIYAWCLMTNHMHLVFRSTTPQTPGSLLGDFKRHTSKVIVKAIENNARESRKELLLQTFLKAGVASSNVAKYQFWRHDNRPCQLWSIKATREKIRYVHNNPVDAGIVFRPEDYIYSSAVDYSGVKGLVNGVVVVNW